MLVNLTFDSSENNYCSDLFIPFVIDPHTRIARLPDSLIWTRTTPTGYEFNKATPANMSFGCINLFQVQMPMIGKKYRKFCYVRQGQLQIADIVLLTLMEGLQTLDTSIYIPYWNLGYSHLSEQEIAQQISIGIASFREKYNNPSIHVFIGIDTSHPIAIKTFHDNDIFLADGMKQTPIM